MRSVLQLLQRELSPARENGRMGEWVNGRMGEWVNGRMGEWENGRMGEWGREGVGKRVSG